jgi:hypothetical protein
MPKLSDLLAEKAKAEIQVGGATVNVTFYVIVRERFTDEEWAAAQSAASGLDEAKLALPKVLQSWDITDDDGMAIPITAEAMERYQIPPVLLGAIVHRVFGSDLAGKARS